MAPEKNINEQNKKLEQMDYNPSEDIFKREKHISLDGDGNPILNEDLDDDKMDKGLDIPGADDDDEMEEIGAEDEENKQTMQKIELWAQEIMGIVYYLDKFGNVYQAEDIVNNKVNPKVISKYTKTKMENGEDVYTILWNTSDM